jgi:hypothetical protein
MGWYVSFCAFLTFLSVQGKPFSSKPHVVVFRNFDVGKVYAKKVKLTNVSYTVNRLQYEGVTTSITDFITVSFDPPGSMSAGMSCNMLVSFTPQVSCSHGWGFTEWPSMAKCPDFLN